MEMDEVDEMINGRKKKSLDTETSKSKKMTKDELFLEMLKQNTYTDIAELVLRHLK
jgi:hypothetical protein